MVVKLREGVVGEPFVGDEGEVLDSIEGEESVDLSCDRRARFLQEEGREKERKRVGWYLACLETEKEWNEREEGLTLSQNICSNLSCPSTSMSRYNSSEATSRRARLARQHLPRVWMSAKVRMERLSSMGREGRGREERRKEEEEEVEGRRSELMDGEGRLGERGRWISSGVRVETGMGMVESALGREEGSSGRVESVSLVAVESQGARFRSFHLTLIIASPPLLTFAIRSPALPLIIPLSAIVSSRAFQTKQEREERRQSSSPSHLRSFLHLQLLRLLSKDLTNLSVTSRHGKGKLPLPSHLFQSLGDEADSPSLVGLPSLQLIPLPRLPWDVLFLVVENSDPATLAVLGRVSLDFLQASARHLYGHVEVKSFKQLQQLFCERTKVSSLRPAPLVSFSSSPTDLGLASHLRNARRHRLESTLSSTSPESKPSPSSSSSPLPPLYFRTSFPSRRTGFLSTPRSPSEPFDSPSYTHRNHISAPSTNISSLSSTLFTSSTAFPCRPIKDFGLSSTAPVCFLDGRGSYPSSLVGCWSTVTVRGTTPFSQLFQPRRSRSDASFDFTSHLFFARCLKISAASLTL